ncbi:lipid A core--O-antigen ligase [Veronia nyctiphanis]|uniref:Lipid A core--O-antigen ligase n=1 Tax=Veronia nyctiphanis TaxID=1278244 RepID=A0A4Q0YM88_9GAMM|nr:Wzy polymerase domain-containing protein [Veronia nyctiphanis]RXJ71957.1 lipid A core--O-antigen ligase [Veronia nyctiphanis]
MLNTLQRQRTTILRKPLTKHLLLSVAVMFLFCLPLSEADLLVSGLHHPAIASTFLIVVVAIASGLLEIARQHTFRSSPLTIWLAITFFIANLPILYVHGDPATSWQTLISTAGCLLFFIALQQFSFNHSQRQLLLWLPFLGAGLIALPLLTPSVQAGLTSGTEYLSSEKWLDPSWISTFETGIGSVTINTSLPEFNHSASVAVLLTSLPLSAYLLARTHSYKKNFTSLHLLLVLAPVANVCALMALNQPWLVTAIVVSATLVQPFLFRFARKIHQGLWNLSVLWGFWFSAMAGWLPDGALLSPLLTEEHRALVLQALQIIQAAPFQGAGDGMLTQYMLLFGLEHNQVLPLPTLFPSWLIGWVAMSGICILIAFTIFLIGISVRLFNAPTGTRLILVTILTPSLIAMLSTSYTDANPTLALLFMTLVFWVDQLTGRYRKSPVIMTRPIIWFSVPAVAASFILVVSSVFISEQLVKPQNVDNRSLALYREHPWWQSYVDDELEQRQFIEDIAQENIRDIEQYLQSRLARVARHPNPDGYQNVIDLAIMLGKNQHAYQLKQEAQMLFPDSLFEPKE